MAHCQLSWLYRSEEQFECHVCTCYIWGWYNPDFAVHGKLIGVIAELCNALSSPLHPVPTPGWQHVCMDPVRNGGIPSGFGERNV